MRGSCSGPPLARLTQCMVRPRVARGMTARLAVRRSCINVSGLFVERFSAAPGHHGHARAFDLISGHASQVGQNGSPGFECAGKTVPPFLAFSSRNLGRDNSTADHVIIFWCPVPWFGRAAVPSSRPAQSSRHRAQAEVETGRRAAFGSCADLSRPRLDGAEHGCQDQAGWAAWPSSTCMSYLRP